MWRQRLAIDQPDRRALERAGWRTFLDYRENHVRDASGRLLGVTRVWLAEAERAHGAVVLTATAGSENRAWARLRREAELAAQDRLPMQRSA